MPVLTSPDFALKFKERWLMLHPEDQENVNGSVTLDDSLTSLQWLQDFSILSASLDKPPASNYQLHQLHQAHQKLHLHGSDAPSSPPAGDTAATGMPSNLGNPTSAATSSTGRQPGLPSIAQGSTEEIDYKANPHIKPPYSYATLICMAMQASKKTKITLSAIYNWITENFCYYRHAEPSWQNSIRHNLSLNKCFMKVPRQKDEPGKGGFWQIDPQYADMFVNGVFKRRRMPTTHFSALRQHKLEPIPETFTATAHLYHLMNEQASSDQQESDHYHHQHQHYHHREQQDQSYSPPDIHRTASKRKQPLPRRSGKIVRTSMPPASGMEEREAESLKGDFDWGSVFEDVFNGVDSSFEDMDINVALNSLGTDIDLTVQGRHISPSNKWCSAYVDHTYLESAPQGPPLEEFATFSDPSRHPWEEVKEEVVWNFDPNYNFCEGYLSEIPPWERVEVFL
ncbi:forkhead box protein J1-B-like [Ambystoma mexicanum]|uniref:forkhead box protein J1-B-like n=1 Tax=Ambystoma mexicanum TaxID=8296 RepID=UPI0037E6FA77